MSPSRWLSGILFFLAAASLHADEPVLKGRNLTEWLAMLDADPKPERRRASVVALEILGDKSPRVVKALGKAARADADDEVRRQSIQLLASIPAEARDAVDDLAAAFKADKVASVRESAAVALGKVGVAGKAGIVLPVLTDGLKDADAKTRASVAEALGRLGPEAETAAPISQSARRQ